MSDGVNAPEIPIIPQEIFSEPQVEPPVSTEVLPDSSHTPLDPDITNDSLPSAEELREMLQNVSGEEALQRAREEVHRADNQPEVYTQRPHRPPGKIKEFLGRHPALSPFLKFGLAPIAMVLGLLFSAFKSG